MQGSELRAIRKALGLNQEQMGKAMDLSSNFISMMEKDKKPIERRTALAALWLRDHPEDVEREI